MVLVAVIEEMFMLNVTKINEIRNLNLIYVFSTNSIFDNDNKKYVGIKLVYNNASILEVDYKDPLFGLLIKRVLERYNKEKDKRNIILLGDFTKELIENASFYVLEGSEEKNNQIDYYSYENKLLNKYKPYLFETIKLISNEILKNPTFEINSMEGYNRKFRLDYSISGISRSTSVLIYNKDDCLHFRIGNIGSSDNYISGTIKQTNNKIISEFNYGNYKGKLEYDPLNSESLKEIYSDDYLYYINDSSETILDEDYKKIKYFLEKMGIQDTVNLLKVNDNTYLCFYSQNLKKDGELLYRDNLILLNFSEDRVDIVKTMKEGFSKYEGLISVLLDEKEDVTTLRKLYDLNNEFLIKETSKDNDYQYEVTCLSEDRDLSSNYSLDGFDHIDVNTIDSIKQYKKGAKK